MSKRKITVIVPVYNEQAGIQEFHSSLVAVLDQVAIEAEIIYIDDGSIDESAARIQKIARTDKRVHPLYLSKNFGKEIATTAGIHASNGDAALVLDADGQHPVELIPEFIRNWKEGYKVVIGVRRTNKNEGFIKKHGSTAFYKILRILGAPDVKPGSTDYRLIDREVIDAFKKLTEHNRVTRSLIDWLGFTRIYIGFDAKARKHGEASYSTRKLVKLAMNGFISLSFAPLYFSGYLGVFITIMSFFAASLTVINKYILHDPLSLNITGTATLAMFILFLVGILMVGQGLLALYIARIYTETQNRPLYIMRRDAKN